MSLHRIVARLSNGNHLLCRMPSKITAETMKRCLEEFVDTSIIKDVHIVKVSPPFVYPQNDQLQSGPWCPFCGKVTERFKWNDYTLCLICWSSNECFEFKNVNKTWFKNRGRRQRRRVKRGRSNKLISLHQREQLEKRRLKKDTFSNSTERRRARRQARRAKKLSGVNQ